MSDSTAEIIARNARVIPGGTASGARALATPIAFAHAEGAQLRDTDGKSYVDLNCAFGAIVLGHRHGEHLARVAELTDGMDLVGLGTTALEGVLAERICTVVPSAEMVAYCSSGTEATFHAIRLARAATKRNFIVKFQGAYHGWHDYVAMNFMSSAEALGTSDPITAGALQASLDATIVLPFNDVERAEKTLRGRGHEIAAVLVEPQMHNVGAIAEEAGFFRRLRDLTEELGIVLIFDEVVTGFRHALGGYQSICGITPDLSTFGKALGNGFPISLIAGRRDLMRRFAPRAQGGDVLLGGTYNGLPMATAAGLAVMEIMARPGQYERLFALGASLRAGLQHAADASGVPMTVTGYGSVCSVHFAGRKAERYEDLVSNDAAFDTAFRAGLLERGIACSTTPLRRFHLTLAHTEAQIAQVANAAEDVLKTLRHARMADGH